MASIAAAVPLAARDRDVAGDIGDLELAVGADVDAMRG